MTLAVTARLGRSTSVVLFAFSMYANPAAAATTPNEPVQKPHVTAPAPAAKATRPPFRMGRHIIYGTILAFNATTIRLQLRSGHVIDVDAAAAIASGNYSAPLFAGKRVCIDGNVSAGSFVASHVFRLTNLTSIPADN